MQNEIVNPLSQAPALSQNAVAEAVTAAEYLQVLMDALGKCPPRQRHKDETSLRTFQRWLLGAGQNTNGSLRVDETMLAQMRDQMRTGQFRQISGKKYASATIRQTSSTIVRLHNTCVSLSQKVARPLVSVSTYERLSFINSLSEATRQALTWFEKNGTHAVAPGRKGPALLTAKSRMLALDEALGLLRALKVTGLEDITEAMAAEYHGPPDHDSEVYRRRIRQMNAVKPLYRSCQEQGLLPANPLTKIPNHTFGDYATRDFLEPEQVKKLLDLKSLGTKGTTAEEKDAYWQRATDRLACLLYYDTALRRTELVNLRRNQVRRSSSGQYEILLRPENQKMVGKAGVTLSIVYPQTNQLLHDYLRACPAVHK